MSAASVPDFAAASVAGDPMRAYLRGVPSAVRPNVPTVTLSLARST